MDINEINHPNGRVLIFEIPSRPQGTAYQYEGRYLMRSGEELVSMSEDQLRKIFDEGKPDYLSEIALENLSPQDVVQLLDTQAFFDLLEIPYPSTTKFPAVFRKAVRVVVYQGKNKIDTKLDRIEEKGSGIDKVIINIEAFQLPALDFRIKSHQTTAFLFAPILFDKMDRSDRIRACYQHCGLKYVNNEKMTTESLRKRFNLKSSQSETASRIIKDTLNEGLIKLDDPTNTSKRYAKYVPFWE